MRPFFPWRAAAVLALAALAACDSPIESPGREPEDLAAMVEALGFRGDMVQDFGDYVLVEGDIRITRDDLRRGRPPRSADPAGPRLQYRTYNLVGSPKVHQITVDVSGLASQPGWQTAAREALTHWNAVPHSYVHMVEGSSADITVTTNCTSSSVAAAASFPSGGNPGAVIQVNTCFGYSTSHAQKVRNMVHELGHTIGFRHTNWQSLGESSGSDGAVFVSQPQGNDPGSVMNGGTALNSWAGFSANDEWATRVMYPLPTPVGTVTYVGGQPVISWAPVLGATGYVVRRVVWMHGQDEFGSFDAYGDYGTVSGGTSPVTDTGWTYTGLSECQWDNGPNDYLIHSYGYWIDAVFPNGYGRGGASAETATC